MYTLRNNMYKAFHLISEDHVCKSCGKDKYNTVFGAGKDSNGDLKYVKITCSKCTYDNHINTMPSTKPSRKLSDEWYEEFNKIMKEL